MDIVMVQRVTEWYKEGLKRLSSDETVPTNRVFGLIDQGQRPGRALLFKYLPEAKGLVTSNRDNSLAVWAHCHLENALSVSVQFSDFRHRWVVPDGQLVLREAVGRDELFLMCFGPQNGAHLGLGVSGTQLSTGGGVPEANVSVSCAATAH